MCEDFDIIKVCVNCSIHVTITKEYTSMKFSSSNNSNMTELIPLSAEDVMADYGKLAALDKAAYKFNADSAVEKSFETLSCQISSVGKAAVEGLSPELRAELAQAFECSVEDLASMNDATMLGKCQALLENKAEASNEDFVVFLGSFVFFYVFTLIILSLAGCKKMNELQSSLKAIFRALDTAFAGKAESALDEIVVNTFSAAEYDKQIKACGECFKILKMSVKDIFDEKYNLANIEKAAGKLWAAPDSWTLDENFSWWNGWRTNMPDTKSQTLHEHGFKLASFQKACIDISNMCKDLITLGEAHKERSAEMKEYFADKRGFFRKIADWFTKDTRTKEQKDYDAQKKLILRAKYEALDNLSRGLAACVNGMAYGMYEACIKAEKLCKKAKPEA